MKDVLASIELIEQIKGPYFRLRVKVGWENFNPGQFVMVKVPEETVFLRRPFGVAKLENQIMEMCFKVVGPGTKALSQVSKGQAINILGPLGDGFAVPKELKTALLVAGGYGIVPLLPLAKFLKQSGCQVVFYYGAKSADDLLYLEEINAEDIDLKIATEDGSAGEKGIITLLLEKEIKGFAQPMLFSSGPEGLLKSVAKLVREHKLPAQISLDSYMACGMGVCLGCMVKSSDGSWVRVCKEGPVFNVQDLKWD